MTHTDSPYRTIELLAQLQAEVERLRDVAARALEREMRADEDADRLAAALEMVGYRPSTAPALAAHDARKAEESDA